MELREFFPRRRIRGLAFEGRYLLFYSDRCRMELECNQGVGKERRCKQNEREAIDRGRLVAGEHEEQDYRQGGYGKVVDKISGEELPHDPACRVPAEGTENNRSDDEREQRHASHPEGEDYVVK